MPPPRRILGIDPGTLRLGYAIVSVSGNSLEALVFGVIRAKGALPGRLKTIYDALTTLARRWKPASLALEDVFFGKDVRAMEKIGEGRAIAKLVAEQHGMTVTEYPPATVKLVVAGNGAAAKESVARMVMAALRLSELPTPADASDALAVALCHCARGVETPAAIRSRRSRGWTTADLARLAHPQ